jgi:hypothetical protein
LELDGVGGGDDRWAHVTVARERALAVATFLQQLQSVLHLRRHFVLGLEVNQLAASIAVDLDKKP